MNLFNKKKYELFYLIILKFFFALTIIDISGDPIIGQRGDFDLLHIFGDLIRNSIIMFLFILITLSILNILFIKKINPMGLLCLFLILTIIFYGLFNGLLRNNPIHAFREFIPVVVILLIPLFLSFKRIELINIAKYFLYMLVIISIIKIILIQFISIMVYGSLSWKVLLRLSPLLIMPFCYFLYTILIKQANKLDYIFMLFVIFAILIANARALILISFFASIIIILMTGLSFRIFNILFILFAATLISIQATDGVVDNSFGIWSGDHLDNTVNHRLIQLNILIERFFNNPFGGFGFGYYNPNYDSYGDLTLPYLLELDLLNFFTKIGIPLSLLYMFTYVLFIYQFSYNKSQYVAIEISFFISLLLLLFYSLFQTAHSGFTFWLFYSLSFCFIFRKL